MNAGYFKSLNHIEQHEFMVNNFPSNAMSISMRGKIYGVAYNDSGHMTQVVLDGFKFTDPCYRQWAHMLQRVFCEKYKARQPTYEKASVCEEWLTFSNFMSWWESKKIMSHELDKDLIYYGNKIYSPETCVFVPRWLNQFTLLRGRGRGAHPVGVSFSTNAKKYEAYCNNPITRKKEHLGLFDSHELAHNAWLRKKIEWADILRPKMDEIDERIYFTAIRIISEAK